MTARRDQAASPRNVPREKDQSQPLPTLRKAKTAALVADEQKAENIVVLDVRGVCNFTDYFVIASCASSVQIKAVANKIETVLREKEERPVSSADRNASSWVILDCGDVVIHLFHPEARNYYRLESLWADAKKVRWARAKRAARTGESARRE